MRTNWRPLPAELSAPARELVRELRNLKDDQGWTLAELGSRTHYARSSWERWVNGKRLVTRSALLSIATATGSDPAPLLALLAIAETDDEPAITDTVALADPASSDAPPVAQLPWDAADFAGREDEVRQLTEVLTSTTTGPGRLPIATVTGGGGLGKTTLAVHVAHRVAHHFPDGQFYVDLRGADHCPRHPCDVLGTFLRDLGVEPGDIPDDLDERAARFRSETARRRILILLDNARDTAQLRPLIPAAPGCAVLSTSRARLPGLTGVQRLDLDLMPAQDARNLLSSIIGAERVDAEPIALLAIIDSCAGLPLALRIAGARLAERPAWSLGGFAARLADRHRRLDELAISDLAIRACFDLSYQQLTSGAHADAADVFRIASLVAASSFRTDEVSALLGRAETEVEATLDYLVDIHLLTGLGHGHYAFHDLIWTYAFERLAEAVSEAARGQALRRLLCWYADTVEAAATLITGLPARLIAPAPEPGTCAPPDFAGPQAALDWCAHHAEALSGAIDLASEHGRPDVAARVGVEMMPYALTTMNADWQGRLERALEIVRQGEDQRDRVAEAWLVHRLGVWHGAWERAELSRTLFAQALALHQAAADGIGEYIALSNLATAHVQREPELTLRYGHRALALGAAAPGSAAISQATPLTALADAYLALGEFERAVEYYRRTLALYRPDDIQPNHAVALANLGDAYRWLGRFEEAVAFLEDSLEVSVKSGSLHGQGYSLCTLGRVFHHFGHPDSARDCWNQALELYQAMGFGPGIAKVRADLAELEPETAGHH